MSLTPNPGLTVRQCGSLAFCPARLSRYSPSPGLNLAEDAPPPEAVYTCSLQEFINQPAQRNDSACRCGLHRNRALPHAQRGRRSHTHALDAVRRVGLFLNMYYSSVSDMALRRLWLLSFVPVCTSTRSPQVSMATTECLRTYSGIQQANIVPSNQTLRMSRPSVGKLALSNTERC